MKTAERQFTTISGVPIDALYGPEALSGFDLAAPGDFPYTDRKSVV